MILMNSFALSTFRKKLSLWNSWSYSNFLISVVLLQCPLQSVSLKSLAANRDRKSDTRFVSRTAPGTIIILKFLSHTHYSPLSSRWTIAKKGGKSTHELCTQGAYERLVSGTWKAPLFSTTAIFSSISAWNNGDKKIHLPLRMMTMCNFLISARTLSSSTWQTACCCVSAWSTPICPTTVWSCWMRPTKERSTLTFSSACSKLLPRKDPNSNLSLLGKNLYSIVNLPKSL